MATKRETLEQAARGEGCLGKAADDEPVFVLRAQDFFSTGLIEAWAARAKAARCSLEKVAEALRCAQDTEAWRLKTNRGKFPD